MRKEVQEHPNRHLEEALMEKLVGVAADIETQFLQYLLLLLHDVGLVDSPLVFAEPIEFI